ncbi:putative Acyl-CoA N-acyltransferase [Vibrio nigripulchritudo SO65]|uniref:GNAT family N-acetyltransferase n=1 Tax=Vibrio nigripulchritudo TaxID=28173 RepID=UPI0003B22481|nr:GNAT family N-acetyltransferase [Vibrio nigripulchritudo]CCN38283.1 putative Acyl-CoA N-acyltransferase [Vibrio nigripulchritudo AM115]CCN43475.1 putative Acyl-CoA N-acyltransferase [Vibrio nigripulchritudo FTn2]CCN65783.1 putative Acyl-CoA N-acyltransferase [Vibrio nigripulchritudo POn4]CCN75330.1 putative Acyl-CoA N-acyltransferase [Vibrio nigripulchritudo SO65]
MFYHQWESQNLVYSEFKDDEMLLAKSLFDKNACCQNVDPTFQVWPESEYLALIQKSAATKTAEDAEAFYLRKISTKSGEVIGYIQFEFNAPKHGTLWIPMLTISPEFQAKGYGVEIVESAIAQACRYMPIKEVGLNVYAENVRAFRFWYKQGFKEIRAFEPEMELGKEYHCLVLYRTTL